MDILKNKIGSYSLLACVVVCAIAVSPFSYDHITTIRYFLWSLFTMALFAFTGIYGDFGAIRNRIVWFFGAYTLCVLISGFLAVNKSEWLYEFLRTFTTLTFLIITITLIDDTVYPVAAVLAVGLSIFGFFRIATGHINGLGGNQNQWAELLVLLIPFCWKHKSIVLLLLINIFFTKCRAAFLVSLVILFILCGKRTRYLVIGLAVIATIYLYNSRGLMSFERIGAWKSTLLMFLDHPFGVGAGNWRIVIPKYGKCFVDQGIFETLSYNKPHNDYLLVLAETGFGGLICYLTFFAYLIKKARNNKVLLSGVAGYMILAFFSFPMEHAIHTILLCVLAGLVFKDYYKPIRLDFWPVVFLLLSFASVDFWFRYNASCQSKEIRLVKPIPDISVSWFAAIDEGYQQSLYLFTGLRKCSFNDFDGALSDFQLAVKTMPYSPVALSVTGMFLVGMNRPAEARPYIDRALSISPTFEPAIKARELLKASGVKNP